MRSDSELLTRYARNRDEAAFAELVGRHIDLVYSAARRRVGGNAHAAAEVTQDVFVALARHAADLARHPVLGAWLHASTRNAAANFRRREYRRERQILNYQAMQSTEPADELDWSAVYEVLDPAMDELRAADRQAIVLRFFENRPYSEIGCVLGVREEAARMRVGRALEKLRDRLGRRGVASTAAALSGALSAHAIASAPPGLTVLVASKATAIAAMASSGSFLSLMGTAKIYSTIIGTALVATVIGVAYRTGAHSKTPPASQPSPAALATGAGAPTQAEARAVALTRWLDDRQSQKRTGPSPATMEAEDKIEALREVLARLPEQNIPEIALATNADWHVAVEGKLETPEDFRRALAKLRSLAEGRFGKLAQPALRDYLRANEGRFPTQPSQLQSFGRGGVDLEMLARYDVVPSSRIANVRMGGDWILTQRELVDSEYDNHLVIGPNGFGSCSSLHSSASRAGAILKPVMAAYMAARGSPTADLGELLPYATTPEQRAAINRLMRDEHQDR